MIIYIDSHLYVGVGMKKEIVSYFKALSDENRMAIIELLIQGETCGCTLIDKVPVTQPTMSYHLNLLEKSGLTNAYKDGVWKKHHVDFDKIDKMILYLQSLKKLKGSCDIND